MEMNQKRCESILIVEDNDAIREALETILSIEGYTTHAVRSGREAIAVLKHVQGPCLILLDLIMPIMNGWDFLKAGGPVGGAGDGRTYPRPAERKCGLHRR